MQLALLLIAAYLIGSIPFAVVVSRVFGMADPRSYGSGNPGATNVLRSGNKLAAALTLAGDAFKGWLAVALAASIAPMADLGAVAVPAAGLAAFLGHLFPLFLGFKGGKGVATYIGCLLGLFWPAALAFAGVWLAMAFTFRISSLSALMASAVIPIGLWATGLASGPLALVLAALAVLVWYRHQENIRRILAGTEPKIGKKKDA